MISRPRDHEALFTGGTKQTRNIADACVKSDRV